MAYFNYVTGVMCGDANMYSLLMCNGWTPYYTSYGRYVGCRCGHFVDEYQYYNAHTGEYVDTYDQLAWDSHKADTFVLDDIHICDESDTIELTGRLECAACGIMTGYKCTKVYKYESETISVD